MPRKRAACLAVAVLAVACSSVETPEQPTDPGGAPDVADVADVADAADVEAAGSAAGCEVTRSDGPLDATHLDPSDAPPAEELYADRPSVGGPHFAAWLPAGVAAGPIEERAAVHNLEHGAVAVYLSADLDDTEVAAITGWAESRNDAGLLDERTGAGLLVAPWESRLEPPVAFRAWGVALDCERFDAVVADGFVRDNFGPAGDAPEGSFGVDPGPVLDSPTDTA